MTIAADLAELERMRSSPQQQGDDVPDMSALQSPEEVFGYIIAWARQQGSDECRMVELLARGAELPPGEVRHIAATLSRLGYREASIRLRQVAGRRRTSLVPLQP
jgi:hypothetical protein